MSEMIVDSFAGGGGASLGIELALGRSPDVAINHDREAIAMHAANHPAARKPVAALKGATFERWLSQLRDLGYRVEWRDGPVDCGRRAPRHGVSR